MTRLWEGAALLCHALVAFGLCVFGLRYLASSEFMTYHAEVAGTPWEALSPGLQTLILAMLRGAGSAILAGGLALGLLLAIPWRRGERWARHGVPVLALCGLVPLLLIAVALTREGADTPLLPIVGAVVLTALGWGLSLTSPGRKPTIGE